VYLPPWSDGLPAALDFAVTAPQRQGVFSESAVTALHAAIAYSEQKRLYQNTAQLCEAQGIVFRPMVCETARAWAPEAAALLKQLAQAAAGRLGQPAAKLYRELLQRTSLAVRLSNARAHLKRGTA
jgi:cytochrome c5